MSDFEMLSIVLMILGIVVTLVIAYGPSHKKVVAPAKVATTFLKCS